MLNTVVEGDVLDVLPNIQNDIAFDVIIADPPYNIGKNFGNNNDSMDLSDYISWSKIWIDLCLSRLKNNGLLYIYGFPEILSHIAVKYPINEQKWLVWHYTNKTVPSSKFWQRSHESILCLWKSNQKRPSLEIDQIRVPYTKSFLNNSAGKKRKGTLCRYSSKGLETTYNAHENGALPRDVMSFPDDVIEISALAGGSGRAERWFLCKTCDYKIFPPKFLSDHKEHDLLKHPTQKPSKLTKQLLLSRVNMSNYDGIVLIPFAGSGSECVVSSLLDIDFIGIELNPDYVDLANKWLEETRKYVAEYDDSTVAFARVFGKS